MMMTMIIIMTGSSYIIFIDKRLVNACYKMPIMQPYSMMNTIAVRCTITFLSLKLKS